MLDLCKSIKEANFDQKNQKLKIKYVDIYGERDNSGPGHTAYIATLKDGSTHVVDLTSVQFGFDGTVFSIDDYMCQKVSNNIYTAVQPLGTHCSALKDFVAKGPPVDMDKLSEYLHKLYAFRCTDAIIAFVRYLLHGLEYEKIKPLRLSSESYHRFSKTALENLQRICQEFWTIHNEPFQKIRVVSRKALRTVTKSWVRKNGWPNEMRPYIAQRKTPPISIFRKFSRTALRIPDDTELFISDERRTQELQLATN